MAREISIIGGGLAGMILAKELLEKGQKVRIFEASGRLGGKAGADLHGTDFDEHGWHLFPTWYVNIWEIVEQLGIRPSFIDKSRYAYIRSGDYPKTTYLESPFSFASALHNLFNGVLPPAISYIYQYALLDLMSQPVRRRAHLDQVTVNGFVRGKFYGIDGVTDAIEDTISRASAIESFEMSAMTVRNVMGFWFNYHNPWFRILTGNLQEKFILPLENKIRSLGCSIELNTTVNSVKCDLSLISSINVTCGDEDRSIPVDMLAIAVPAPNMQALLNPEIIGVSPDLGKIYYLRSRIMAGMTIYFKTKIAGIPSDHLNFVKTKYELSMIDVTDIWGIPDRSVICVVASDYTVLQGHSVDEATTVLIRELNRYLPFVTPENIERIDLQPHVHQPLFANTAGAWSRRPTATTKISNLFLAGDYCRTHVDLTCMEGAVTSGLIAAKVILKEMGISHPVVIRTPKTRPRWLLVLLKFLLFPGVLLALAYAAVQTAASGRARRQKM